MILAGDHRQLGPAVRSVAAAALEESLMERLIGRQIYAQQLGQLPAAAAARPAPELRPTARVVVKLLNNYRSHSDLIELPRPAHCGPPLLPPAAPTQCT